MDKKRITLTRDQRISIGLEFAARCARDFSHAERHRQHLLDIEGPAKREAAARRWEEYAEEDRAIVVLMADTKEDADRWIADAVALLAKEGR